jgi:hypothetical protein
VLVVVETKGLFLGKSLERGIEGEFVFVGQFEGPDWENLAFVFDGTDCVCETIQVREIEGLDLDDFVIGIHQFVRLLYFGVGLVLHLDQDLRGHPRKLVTEVLYFVFVVRVDLGQLLEVFEVGST